MTRTNVKFSGLPARTSGWGFPVEQKEQFIAQPACDERQIEYLL